MDKAVIKKSGSKAWKRLVVTGLMLAGFALAFLAARAARNDLAAWTPRDLSNELSAPVTEVDK